MEGVEVFRTGTVLFKEGKGLTVTRVEGLGEQGVLTIWRKLSLKKVLNEEVSCPKRWKGEVA